MGYAVSPAAQLLTFSTVAMKILPVIDLLGGTVVRGVGGRRAEYRPIMSTLSDDPSPPSVARAFHEKLGCDDCYVADLDAIAGRNPSVAAYEEIVAAGLQPWIDAGTGDVAKAAPLARWLEQQAPQGRLVVGLESLKEMSTLSELVEVVGSDRIVFSLDLKAGKPLTANAAIGTQSPLEIAAAAVEAGIGSLIMLDLTAVGMNDGVPTLELCHALRERFPQLELISGGGVRSQADLQSLEAAGCNRALVASALHEGIVGILRPGSP